MIPFVIYLLAAFGVSFGIGYSELTYNFRRELSKRDFKWTLKLLECPGCLGFWTGIAAAATEIVSVPFSPHWLGVVVLGFATCGSNLLLAKLAGLSEP